MKKFTYLERDIIHSLKMKMNNKVFRAGRRVVVTAGIHKGIEGVVQDVTHVPNKPLKDNKIRVWLDGKSCIDIFDFSLNNLKLIPYVHEPNLGYY